MTELRHDWQFHEIAALYDLPFFELIYQAHSIHRNNFPEHPIQLSTLLSIKTGTCPEDCAYCPQSGHYQTGVNKQKLMDKDEVIAKAKQAQAMGATRFCMGAAWRSPPQNEFLEILEMIQEIKKLGLESCVTLGMLTEEQAEQLKEAGLDYYNHNIDTSPAYYEKIITTRTFADRIETLKNLRKADIKVCCGGIMGLGETRSDRIEFLLQLANLPEHPESVPINRLIAIKGTPLEKLAAIDNFEFVRTIAIARIIMPVSVVRLSAGRESMSEEMQALCFFAGANSIHYGERLLTANNPDQEADMLLIKKLGLQVIPGSVE